MLEKTEKSGMLKDTNTGAILNLDINKLELYRKQKKQMMKSKEEMDAVKTDIHSLKTDMDEIKMLLTQLVSDKNNGN